MSLPPPRTSSLTLSAASSCSSTSPLLSFSSPLPPFQVLELTSTTTTAYAVSSQLSLQNYIV
ncbi:hypothetical protein VDGD_21669 [Verticillium dahliae]|nr:hypothetical protein VDGD_21669 [Verticillium dahliae]